MLLTRARSFARSDMLKPDAEYFQRMTPSAGRLMEQVGVGVSRGRKTVYLVAMRRPLANRPRIRIPLTFFASR
ncbi:MAG: hypothetical protein ACLPV8_06510 [Steroidobacteraceae bacterium]